MRTAGAGAGSLFYFASVLPREAPLASPLCSVDKAGASILSDQNTTTVTNLLPIIMVFSF